MPLHPLLQRLDRHRADRQERPALRGLSRFCSEFFWFGIKEARSFIFAGLFFLALFLVPRGGLLGLARYDVLLLISWAPGPRCTWGNGLPGPCWPS